jgi:spore coat protein CotF
MHTLELTSSELLMLKDMTESDIESTGWSEIDYSDPELMQFYADRAKVYVRIQQELST